MVIEDGIEQSSYNGNPNLKKPRESINWTQEQLEEYIRCSKDPVYFCEKYIKLVHVDKGFIPMLLYDYQKEIVDKIFNNRRVAVLTSRQAGKTSTAVAVILHYVIFNSFKRVAILANKAAAASEVLQRIKLAYESLPKWLQHGIIRWNAGDISLENGSSIITGATTSSSIRGKSINFLYIDEAAFIDTGWDEFFSSVYPTISSGESTKILMTSTCNGLNHFFSICTGAKEGTNGYQYVEVKWDRVPGRGEAWKQETLQALNFNYEQFEVEFECRFAGSSGTLISGNTLQSLVPQHPIAKRDGLSQYEPPNRSARYVIVADVSRGKGLDYSAFHVIDITEMPYRQAATYRNNMVTPVDYAVEIHRISKLYNDATILVEINDIGGQVADSLYFDYECENLIYTENAGARGKRISGGGGASSDRGIRTTKTVKSVGCSILKLLVEQQQLIINDQETIYELSRFSRKGNSYEAESGAHDDLVMGLVLFAWLTDQQYFKELTDISTLQRLRDRTDEEIEESLTPFGFMNDGLDEYAAVIDYTETPTRGGFF